MVLPRLVRQKQVAAPLRRQFAVFQARVRKHEETHRAIYLACFKKVRRAMLNLKGREDCGSFVKDMQRTFDTIIEQCNAENAALDNRDGQQVSELPVIRHALREVASGATPAELRAKLRMTVRDAYSGGNSEILIDHTRDR